MTLGRDYLALARQYEDDILSGAIPSCKWVRLAVERNRRDLARQRTEAFPYYFDSKAAAAVCRFIESMPHVKGEWSKPLGRREDGSIIWATITLEPHQIWKYGTFFGWKRTADNLRRFRTGYDLQPRKNAKTTPIAAVLLYLATADGEQGAECYSAATTRPQASVVTSIAIEMARRNPEFREWFGVQVNARDLEISRTASLLRPLSSDAGTLDALNTHACVIDELHAHKTRAVWDVMETSTGARRQPVIWVTSTAGESTVGILVEQLTHLQKVLEQRLDDETVFGVYYTIDEEDIERWDQEDVWRKANPNYGVSVKPDDLARLALKAKHSPAARATFLIKRLNVFTNAEHGFINAESWDRCANPDEVQLELLHGTPCRIAIDLAQVRDVASIGIGFEHEDGRLSVICEHYLPKATVDASPIAQMSGWVVEGRIKEIEGNVQDFNLLEDRLQQLADDLNAYEVLFDPALAAHMMQNMQRRLGEDRVKQVPQSVAVLDPAMKEFERRVLTQDLEHDGDPVLAWMVSNVVVKRDYKDQIYPRKMGGKDSPNKIDGFMTILFLLARMLEAPLSEMDEDGYSDSVYDERGFLAEDEL